MCIGFTGLVALVSEFTGLVALVSGFAGLVALCFNACIII
jgi:hypothetical protein